MATSPLPTFAAAAPTALNLGNLLRVTLTITNTGSAVSIATRVTVKSIALGTLSLVSPSAFPVIEGDIGASGTIEVGAIFDGRSAVVGQNYLLTVRGTYDANGVTYGFAFNSLVKTPAVSAPVRLLSAKISSAPGANRWDYVITNTEPSTSAFFIADLGIDIYEAFAVSATPAGWTVDTDNKSYVLWSTDDLTRQIGPGKSLGGFQISSGSMSSEAAKAVVTSWDHSSKTAGPVFFDRIYAPSRA